MINWNRTARFQGIGCGEVPGEGSLVKDRDMSKQQPAFAPLKECSNINSKNQCKIQKLNFFQTHGYKTMKCHTCWKLWWCQNWTFSRRTASRYDLTLALVSSKKSRAHLGPSILWGTLDLEFKSLPHQSYRFVDWIILNTQIDPR